MQPNLPRFDGRTELTSKNLNDLLAAIRARENFSVIPPLEMIQTSGGIVIKYNATPQTTPPPSFEQIQYVQDGSDTVQGGNSTTTDLLQYNAPLTLIKITGNSGLAYSWIEQTFNDLGQPIDAPDGKTGTFLVNPTYDINQISIKKDLLVWIFPGAATDTGEDELTDSCADGFPNELPDANVSASDSGSGQDFIALGLGPDFPPHYTCLVSRNGVPLPNTLNITQDFYNGSWSSPDWTARSKVFTPSSVSGTLTKQALPPWFMVPYFPNMFIDSQGWFGILGPWGTSRATNANASGGFGGNMIDCDGSIAAGFCPGMAKYTYVWLICIYTGQCQQYTLGAGLPNLIHCGGSAANGFTTAWSFGNLAIVWMIGDGNGGAASSLDCPGTQAICLPAGLQVTGIVDCDLAGNNAAYQPSPLAIDSGPLETWAGTIVGVVSGFYDTNVASCIRFHITE